MICTGSVVTKVLLPLGGEKGRDEGGARSASAPLFLKRPLTLDPSPTRGEGGAKGEAAV